MKTIQLLIRSGLTMAGLACAAFSLATAGAPVVLKPYEPEVNLPALRRAVEDLAQTQGDRYAGREAFLERLARLEAANAAGQNIRTEFAALQREALLANPLLDFEEMLVVRRPLNSPSLGLPRNWESNCSLPATGYDDDLCSLRWRSGSGSLTPVFRTGGRFLGDVDLHWDADRVLFSMPGTNGRWQVFELTLPSPAGTAGSRKPGSAKSTPPPRQLTGEQQDVDSYDACYLPNGRIAFTSTAFFVGVPCVNGSAHVANLYLMDADGRNIRQLCFDQEHNWCPTVMNDGRLLYSRWEYTDTPHSNTRLLFTMNPDGTSQSAWLGSGSYWPNSFFYARPVPNHPTRVIAVIGGHHDNPRMGELVLFDPRLGRLEGDPVVQRIPGFGKKVEPLIRDGLTLESWPKFLHPWPLSEKYFLVSCKPGPEAPWGIYLVDVFDNLLPIQQEPDVALMEPVPLKRTQRPPVIPERVNTTRKDAIVTIQDIYSGEGLQGVPRGTVKSLRIFSYHYAYQGMGGLLGVVGMDGPWDIKRVLGTVPVEPDGSARFRVPANLPISVQPLDSGGRAMQLMRSWMTAMPGENLQCTGCHDRQNQSPLIHSFQAMKRPPSEIRPWYGSARGFSFAREVQPVLDRHCVRCHDGRQTPPDLRGTQRINDWASVTPGNGGYTGTAGRFSASYAALHRFVRRPGIESDYHVLEPLEFHADTTHLVQLLQKGHHGVQLDEEGWDRLITWIDLNCPYHGTWGEEIASPGKQRERRRELLKRYANLEDDPEQIPPSTGVYGSSAAQVETAVRTSSLVLSDPPVVQGWPFDGKEARQRQLAGGTNTTRQVEIVPGVNLELVWIPAGEFLIGSADGAEDEKPQMPVRISRPFWMGKFEISNAQYACFDAKHDSRVEDKNTYQFGIHGYPANSPAQPVVRLSWNEAMEFCRWLGTRTGLRFSLPTESQWEWACRAGSSDAFSFGQAGSDFSGFANLADGKLSEFASDPYTIDKPLANPTRYDDWIPKEPRFNDGALISVPSGRYRPNFWGLHDMHGNVSEWTLSDYQSHGALGEPRAARLTSGRKVVRGGSWRDLPARATSSYRLAYEPWQRVYNVGFRVVCESDDETTSKKVSVR